MHHLDLERRITVDKDAVLKSLKENKEKHKKTYETALEGWRIEVRERLTKELQKAELNKDPNLNFSNLAKPTHQLDEYEVAIEMLEMDIQPTIELSSSEFRRFVKDQWDNRDHWLASNTRYLETAASASHR
ncbi:MAG: hypothetical protein HC888_04800 [Candidatus Competibacteraceae bacterium]|nr:hypothetical protein [Candidatus Competibacteraceae bacterium]